MIPYIFLLLTIFLFSYFDRSEVDRLLYWFLVFFLLLFSGLRFGGVGTGDYFNYLEMYELIDSWDRVIYPIVHAEIGFRVIAWLGNVVGVGGQFIIFSMALLALVFPAYIIYKYSPYKCLSLLVMLPYFFTMNMHSSRTAVAASLGLMFLVSLSKNKVFYSFIWFLLAISFHSSAVSLIIAFFAKVSFRWFVYIFLLGSASLLVLDPFDVLRELFYIIGYDRVVYAIDLYSDSSSSGYPLKLYDPRVILYFTLSVVLISCRKSCFFNKMEFWFKIFILGSFLLIFFSSSTIIAWRVSYYFLISGILVVPYLALMLDARTKDLSPVGPIRAGFIAVYTVYAARIIMQAEDYRTVMV